MRGFAKRAVIGAWAAAAIGLLGGIFASGAAVAAPVASVYASGFGAVDDVKFDAAGNLYVNDNGGASRPVWMIAPGGTVSSFVTGRSFLVGMAFDGAGNLFVNESGPQVITKITPAASTSTFASLSSGPRGIAFDTAGNLYVAIYFSSKVIKITPGGVVSDYATGIGAPWALAFNSTGDLFVSRLGNSGAGSVVKVAAGCVVPCSATTFMSGLTNPQGLAVDGADNVYAAALDNVIRKATPAGVVTTVSTDPLLNGPTGMTFDTAGNLYAGNFGDGKVIKLAGAGAPPVPVPTLSTWWLISLALALAGSGVVWLRLRAVGASS
jgi:hypothetical protein